MAITIIQDIHNEIRNIKRMGYDIEKIEAFLIHCEDKYALLKYAHDHCSEYGFPCTSPCGHEGEMRIRGIKIIDSKYVQQGTIHKIFKNEQPYMYPPKSGPINFPKHLRLPTVADEKKTKKRHSTTRKVELSD